MSHRLIAKLGDETLVSPFNEAKIIVFGKFCKKSNQTNKDINI
ncbi:hypothetical protein MNB_SV-6-896 [hydrothermal vent metagenome]|uniref:Uncharacterized protein n=1 Tax=hydrothermal vent metagenome TaxID=652676 RepID=A0A1W1BLI4_9ZZZZ